MFTLLHTNDFHNSLTAAQSNYLQRLRSALGCRGLLIDAGDAVASGNITFRSGGETILRTMSVIGYDALTVGNREFHFSQYGFRSKLSQAQFPVLCANIRPTHLSASADHTKNCLSTHQSNPQDTIPPVAPYLIRTLEQNANSLRVLLVGLTVPMITESMMSRRISAYVFDDPLACAADLIPALRGQHQPDIVVAVTHIGLKLDRKLAAAVPGIDLIIGGHSHDVLEHGERVRETLIVQAGSHGRFVGRVDVEVTPTSNARPRCRASLIALPKGCEDNAETEGIAST